jgi:phosphoglycolate phosphatase-like HAD superfamily hydrolase
MVEFTKKNIILDMDGTLLDSDIQPTSFIKQKEKLKSIEELIPIPRPHLKKFLEFVFEHFTNVSIWTNAVESWYNKCYEEIFKYYLPEGKSFHFVRHRSHNRGKVWLIKPLQEIYELYPGEYTEYNTLIVDDNHQTYSLNTKNAIPIKPFFYDLIDPKEHYRLDEYDTELLQIIDEIKNYTK